MYLMQFRERETAISNHFRMDSDGIHLYQMTSIRS